jgi:hypothetical protein
MVGIPELIILAFVGVPIVGGVLYYLGLDRRAHRSGYRSTFAYLRAIPRSDAEKQDAADLAMKGLLWCVLGLFFSPCVFIGLIPLYYGGRKLVSASMGLGLVDDGDTAGA